MSKTNEEIKCVWELDSAHSEGDVKFHLIFDGQLDVPMCNNHWEEHMDIMTLSRNGYEQDKVLEMSQEDRRKEVLTLKMSGIDVSNVTP